MTVYESSTIKRNRRTKRELENLKEEIYRIVEEQRPMTVRQVFYQMVSRGLIEKTEGEYQKSTCRLLSQMRLEGALPWNWIADHTRYMRKPDTYSSLKACLDATANLYRRDLWRNQGFYAEVWLEKEALSGVIEPVTEEWDVPLMVTRGYASLTFLQSAGSYIGGMEKPAFIFYLGDSDASGLDIARTTEKRLREFSNDAEIHFFRIAVTDEQVEEFNLPGRPPKMGDSREKDPNRRVVEVDALPPAYLRALVNEYIVGLVDEQQLAAVTAAEASEREILKRLVGEQSW